MSRTAAVVDALIRAHTEGVRVDAEPFAQALTNEAEAYQVSEAVARAVGGEAGADPGHWKSGAPNRQSAATHAWLPRMGVQRSPGDARKCTIHQHGVEPEIALRLGEAVDAQMARALNTLEEACTLVDAMAVSIELVDSRWVQGFSAPMLLRLADWQCHAALVLGEWQPWRALDWAQQTFELRIGARAPLRGQGAHPCVHPAWGLGEWLRHATRDGAVLPAGTVVTTGSWAGMCAAEKGDAVELTFDGIGQASVLL